MRFFSKAAIAAAVAALCVAAVPAKADVIYDFNQTGLTVNLPELLFDGDLTLTNGAARSGRPQTVLNSPSVAPYSANAPGVRALNLDFTFSDGSRQPLSVDLATFTTPRPPFSSGFFTSFALVGTLNGLFGNAVFNNTETDFLLTFSGTRFTGELSSDGPQGCFFARCSFGGDIVIKSDRPTPVPEPASMALFGVGLAGLGLIRRKRAA